MQIDNQASLYAKGIFVRNNVGTQVGGGIQVLTYSSFEITDSFFYDNEAGTASAINILQPSKVNHDCLYYNLFSW